MRYKPHNYQTQATGFIINHDEAAVFLGMGLGKSVIALTAIRQLVLDYFLVQRVPVIAPLRVARDTDDQFVLENFFLGQGNQDERVQMIGDHFYIEQDSVYRRKNRALDRLGSSTVWQTLTCTHALASIRTLLWKSLLNPEIL